MVRRLTLFVVDVVCAAFGERSAHAHPAECSVVPIADVDPVLLHAAGGDVFSVPPLVANDCMHGTAHLWRFFWGVQQVDGFWRAYGFARCYVEQPTSCHASYHVVTGDDASYIDVPRGISLPRLRELVGAIASIDPKARVAAVTFGTVNDGTRWSQERFGYEISYRESDEPPESINSVRLVERCGDGGCRWLARPESFYSGVRYGRQDAGCGRLEQTGGRAFAAMKIQMHDLINTPPADVVTCRLQDFDRVYIARYPALEHDGGWKTDAEIQCAVEDLETSEVPQCKVAVLARNAATREISSVALGIPLHAALELREAGLRRAAGGERVVSVGYQGVNDGGAWSARGDGYQIGVGHDGGGRYLHAIAQCGPDGCAFRVVDEPLQVQWAD